jgi:uncharacterized protein
MRDGALRRTLKRVALWHFEINLGLHRALLRLRGERPFLLSGSCRRCASCCEAPAIAVGRAFWFLPAARTLFLAWQRHVNGFELVERQRRGRVFVFRCTHFDRENRSCDSYLSRPGMCRDYPRLILWQGHPEFLPSCGYGARAPNTTGLKAELARLDLSAEQRERLTRGLDLPDD